jgi:hypothetical protein
MAGTQRRLWHRVSVDLDRKGERKGWEAQAPLIRVSRGCDGRPRRRRRHRSRTVAECGRGTGSTSMHADRGRGGGRGGGGVAPPSIHD